ncbi:MAG: TorF family putative porin [Rhodocyclales bacterium]|nr:TorF family putative porin [Rhodocyclales bacterium]
MRKSLLATAVATAFAAPAFVLAADAAPTPTHTFTPNIGVVSDYLFRGVSQTHGAAALQGGVDYAHASGLYAGIWASTITWVKDANGKGNTEVDLYGGYKNSFAGGDWNYDVGLITYNYPGHGPAVPNVNATPNTTEVYGAIGYKWLTLKYSQAVSTNFIGWQGGALYNKNTRGSDYLELNAAYDLGEGWGLGGHYGTQKVKNSVNVAGGALSANYSDWNIGVTKELSFGVVGLTYSDTDTKGTCSQTGVNTNPYCWGAGNWNSTQASTTNFRDVSKGTLVLSFKKTF